MNISCAPFFTKSNRPMGSLPSRACVVDRPGMILRGPRQDHAHRRRRKSSQGATVHLQRVRCGDEIRRGERKAQVRSLRRHARGPHRYWNGRRVRFLPGPPGGAQGARRRRGDAHLEVPGVRRRPSPSPTASPPPGAPSAARRRCSSRPRTPTPSAPSRCCLSPSTKSARTPPSATGSASSGSARAT